jgi:hypothetical protein
MNEDMINAVWSYVSLRFKTHILQGLGAREGGARLLCSVWMRRKSGR